MRIRSSRLIETIFALNRTLVYLEGEASMRKYESKDGKVESALSIVQRKCHPKDCLYSKFEGLLITCILSFPQKNSKSLNAPKVPLPARRMPSKVMKAKRLSIGVAFSASSISVN